MNKVRFGVLLLSLFLAACSSPKRYLANEIIYSDRQQNIVLVGYPYQGNPRYDSSSLEDWTLSQSSADVVCRRWGKGKAMLQSETSSTSGKHDYFDDLIEGAVYKVYVCSD